MFPDRESVLQAVLSEWEDPLDEQIVRATRESLGDWEKKMNQLPQKEFVRALIKEFLSEEKRLKNENVQGGASVGEISYYYNQPQNRTPRQKAHRWEELTAMPFVMQKVLQDTNKSALKEVDIFIGDIAGWDRADTLVLSLKSLFDNTIILRNPHINQHPKNLSQVIGLFLELNTILLDYVGRALVWEGLADVLAPYISEMEQKDLEHQLGYLIDGMNRLGARAGSLNKTIECHWFLGLTPGWDFEDIKLQNQLQPMGYFSDEISMVGQTLLKLLGDCKATSGINWICHGKDQRQQKTILSYVGNGVVRMGLKQIEDQWEMSENHFLLHKIGYVNVPALAHKAEGNIPDFLKFFEDNLTQLADIMLAYQQYFSLQLLEKPLGPMAFFRSKWGKSSLFHPKSLGYGVGLTGLSAAIDILLEESGSCMADDGVELSERLLDHACLRIKAKSEEKGISLMPIFASNFSSRTKMAQSNLDRFDEAGKYIAGKLKHESVFYASDAVPDMNPHWDPDKWLEYSCSVLAHSKGNAGLWLDSAHPVNLKSLFNQKIIDLTESKLAFFGLSTLSGICENNHFHYGMFGLCPQCKSKVMIHYIQCDNSIGILEDGGNAQRQMLATKVFWDGEVWQKK